MPQLPKKLNLQEAVNSSVVFYNDEGLEDRFDDFIEERIKKITHYEDVSNKTKLTEDSLIEFFRTEEMGLELVIGLARISREKFLRIVTLLRRLDGSFDREWSMHKVERNIRSDDGFAKKIANLFINGSKDPILAGHLPRFYRERLNLSQLFIPQGDPIRARLDIKSHYLGTYGNWKGDSIEELIRTRLVYMRDTYGVGFDRGSTPLINVTVDWAIPNLSDPHVLVMSSYQETTSSGQSTKAREMIDCYQTIERRNLQHHEDRAFVNFVDGGGWLARYSDLQRLVAGCHYFLNIANLDMLDSIIIKHVPSPYFTLQPPPKLT